MLQSDYMYQLNIVKKIPNLHDHFLRQVRIKAAGYLETWCYLSKSSFYKETVLAAREILTIQIGKVVNHELDKRFQMK